MAFNSNDFLPLSGMANSNAVRVWTYSAVADTITDTDYFDSSAVAGVVNAGDVLLGLDAGGTSWYRFTTVTNVAGAPNVIISDGVAIT
tara:strand:- start:698 stop:961 length:264 start_codon:yes stop_codon:yes gene_type:complete